jgi:hypothetical protein
VELDATAILAQPTLTILFEPVTGRVVDDREDQVSSMSRADRSARR